MFECPFELISCSWPCPIEQKEGMWTSVPAWDAPLLPLLPQPQLEIVDDAWCWMLNWSDIFQCELKAWAPVTSGEMRGFYVIFSLQMKKDGILIFRDTDGCIIRHRANTKYHHPSSPQPSWFECVVKTGDYLDIAQRHLQGEWIWGAYLAHADKSVAAEPLDPARALTIYLERIQDRLCHPNGPPLKMYTNGHTPIRSVVALYSMILNGYIPSAVYLFGEHQWSKREREILMTLLPFASIIPTDQIHSRLHSLGGSSLVEMAQHYWFVMKMCVSLLYPPDECCMMDDDVFILDPLDDALRAFQTNDLVYAPDLDCSRGYVATWGMIYESTQPLRTANFNAGLFWMRNTKDQYWLATQALQAPPTPNYPFYWEQGFIAVIFANDNTFELPCQQYFSPVIDGLPLGVLGYDYAHNPCGFACIHFNGFLKKPSNSTVLYLAPQILNRGKNR